MEILVIALIGIAMRAARAVVGALFLSVPVMWLWNAVIPDVAGLKSLAWAQALWLSMLCGLLMTSGSSSELDTK